MRAASFLTLQPGTPVVDRFGEPVGKVHRVLVLETGGFDGIVVATDAGTRFVDAPEVRRIYGMPEARYDRVDVTEADRDEAIECLKRGPLSVMCPFPDGPFVSQATIHPRRKP